MSNAIRRDQTISRTIDKKLIEANKAREKSHNRSGKLSAGKLGQPLQWQVLHTLGVPSEPFDAYTLRKLKRGVDVEEWLVGQMDGVIDTQVFCEYRNVVGYVDALVDHENYEFKLGVIPHEVKSVANSKFKYIEKRLVPDESHALQGALYALALGKGYFAINYVASDDYRIECFILDTANYKSEIDSLIDEYDKAMEAYHTDGSIPVFEPKEKWQVNKKYNGYHEYADMTASQLKKAVQEVLRDES